ncbi:hypothetical protein BK645_30050 [Pseudomonas protegens]|nr:hypothetical protein BK645_30050 [Pseudomonas protegens]ROM32484.1 hypothetical protein BK646_26135 [Pseudomonas protegens]
MARVYSSIEQANTDTIFVATCCALQELICPFSLLNRGECVEEFRCFFCPSDFRDFVEQSHRLGDGCLSSVNVDDRALRKDQRVSRNLKPEDISNCTKALKNGSLIVSGRQPELPPDGFSDSHWQRRRVIRPERTERCGPYFEYGVQEKGITWIAFAGVDFQVLIYQAFKRTELSIRDENSRKISFSRPVIT